MFEIKTFNLKFLFISFDKSFFLTVSLSLSNLSKNLFKLCSAKPEVVRIAPPTGGRVRLLMERRCGSKARKSFDQCYLCICLNGKASLTVCDWLSFDLIFLTLRHVQA